MFKTHIDLDSHKALMQIHLAVPTEESCENCCNSTEIIFLSCFNGLVPYWSTQRSWPLENTAIKNLHLDIQEKSLHQGSFLLWTGCMWRLPFPTKRALGWPYTVGSDIPLSAFSGSGCCESFGIAVHWSGFFGLFCSVCGLSCTQRWTVGGGWAEIHCWEWALVYL